MSTPSKKSTESPQPEDSKASKRKPVELTEKDLDKASGAGVIINQKGGGAVVPCF